MKFIIYKQSLTLFNKIILLNDKTCMDLHIFIFLKIIILIIERTQDSSFIPPLLERLYGKKT